MDLDISPPSDLAKIAWMSDDELRLVLRYPNGKRAQLALDMPLPYEVGDVVLVAADGSFIAAASEELWPDQAWPGVVRLRDAELTIVDRGGAWQQVPTNDVTYTVGNTVLVNEAGVIRVLSERSIRLFDPPDRDEDLVSRFKQDPVSDSQGFDEFGGLEAVVDRARELIEVPLKKHAMLGKIGARPVKGVLFTGPPGTGKTMLARLIAAEADATFYEISGPEVLSKWYGESEKVVRDLFERAASDERAIIFFDEIDSVASQRAEDAHEVSRRVVAQLLTEMDGFTQATNVVVIATTNRVEGIDTALRRPGRFDWEIRFGLPGSEDREKILRASAANLEIADDLPHATVARMTGGWSAAELTLIWSEAALLAVSDERARIMAGDYLGAYERVRQRVRERASEDKP